MTKFLFDLYEEREPDPELVGQALALVDAGWTVGVLSNVDARLGVELRRAHAWLEDMAAVIFSGDIGVELPSPEAYAVAVDALGGGKATFFSRDPLHRAGANSAGLEALREFERGAQ